MVGPNPSEEKLELMKAGRRLFQTAMMSFPEMKGDKARVAAKILNEAHAKPAELAD